MFQTATSGSILEQSTLHEVFAALANDDRRQILHVLQESKTSHPEGLSITAISDAVELTRFATSRHLKILVAAELVEAEEAERSVLHRILPSGFACIEDWLWGLVED